MPETQATVVTVTNRKGGTGKTITSINLGGALSEAGFDVLFVDLDPQGNASETLGFQDEYDSGDSGLAEILVDGVDVAPPIREQIVEHQEMDVIPAHRAMSLAQRDITDPTNLREWTQQLSSWDYIVLDTPPAIGPIADSSILAADVLLPVSQARESSKRSVSLLGEELDELEERFGYSPDIVGIVCNEIRPDQESEKMVSWLEDLGVPIICIRTRVALQRAASAGISTFEHSEESGMESQYRRLAEVVMEGESDD